MHAQTATLDATHAKVIRARDRALALYPWFGALCRNLRVRRDTRIPTMATDGTHLFYNPAGCAPLSEPVLMFIWAHEVMHCALLHMYRKPTHLDWHEWNVCTDLAINCELVKLAVGEKPANCLYDPQYANLAAEQIAHARRKARQQAQAEQAQRDQEQAERERDQADSDSDSESDQDSDQDGDDSEQDGSDAGDQDGESESDQDGSDQDSDSDQDADADAQADGGQADTFDPDGSWQPGDDCLPPSAGQDGTDQDDTAGHSDAPDGTPRDEADWQVSVDQVSAAMRKAGEMPGSLVTMVSATRKTRTDWREVTHAFIEQVTPTDYTWRRANRRYQSQGLYLPGTNRENLPPMMVIVDSSGSCGQDECDTFASALTDILSECRPRAIYVVYCDTQVNGEMETFTPDADSEVSLTARGGGGTYFQPAFDWVANAMQDGTITDPPACILYLTDGYAADLHRLTAPEIPTLFAIVPGGTVAMPFGEVIEMELE